MIWFTFREWENQAQNGIRCCEPKIALESFFLSFYGIRNRQKMFKHLIGILEEISINYLGITYAAGVGVGGQGEIGRIEVQVNGR